MQGQSGQTAFSSPASGDAAGLLPCRPGRRPLRIVRAQSRICVGGPAYMIATLCQHMRPPAYRCLLVGGRLEPGEVSLEPDFRARGIDVHILPEMGRAVRPLDDLRAVWKFYRLLRRVRPDIVDTHTAKAGFVGRIAARLAGVPVTIHTFHGHVFSGYFGPFKTRAILLAERALARITSSIVATTPLGKRDLAEVYRVAPASRIETILYGIDRQRFEQAPARFAGQLRAELGLGPQTRLVALIGRLVPVKNHSLWFRSIARLPESLRRQCKFLVIGDGELRQELESQVRQLGLSRDVLFLGTRQDTERIYADLDLLVLASKNEGTGIVLIEAMYAAVPVISTDVGAVRDALPANYPYLVRPDDPAALAAAMQALLQDDPRRRAFGATLPAAVGDKWDVRRYIRQHAELYWRLVRRHCPARYRLWHGTSPTRRSARLRQLARPLCRARMGLIAYMPYHVGPDGTAGCAEWWLDQFLDELARHVARVDYIGPCATDRIGRRGKIRYLPLPPFRGELDFVAKLASYLWRLGRLLGNYDIIQPRLPGHLAYIGWVVARCLGKPAFVYVGGDWGQAVRYRWLAGGWIRRLLARPYTRLLTRLSELAIRTTPSFIAGSELYRRYRRLGPSVYLYHSASHRSNELTTARPEQLEQQMDPQRPVLYLGRIAAEKGIDVLLEALALLRDAGQNVRLTIAGQGYHLGPVQARCKELGLDALVNFAGFIAERRRIS
ncbi:MAG: glycosyltransferase, partial [Phycisphaerae bacterium]